MLHTLIPKTLTNIFLEKKRTALWLIVPVCYQAAMVTCEGCSKTFLPHRLEAHLRVCSHPRAALPVSPQKSLQVRLQNLIWTHNSYDPSTLSYPHSPTLTHKRFLRPVHPFSHTTLSTRPSSLIWQHYFYNHKLYY